MLIQKRYVKRLNTTFEYALDEDTNEKELIELIHKLNDDDKVNGILVRCHCLTN